jgi:hypothetical protein
VFSTFRTPHATSRTSPTARAAARSSGWPGRPGAMVLEEGLEAVAPQLPQGIHHLRGPQRPLAIGALREPHPVSPEGVGQLLEPAGGEAGLGGGIACGEHPVHHALTLAGGPVRVFGGAKSPDPRGR